MNNYNIEYIVKIVLNVLIIGIILYVVLRLFIFLLPVIIVLIILYYVYRIYLETKNKVNNKKQDKKNNIIEAEIVNERFDK